MSIAFEHLMETSRVLVEIDQEPIAQTIEILRKAKKDGNQVFLFGNGGSHSNASHFANDLLKACGIKAICISDMIPTILAYNNDDGKDFMFQLPFSYLKNDGDIIFGISCSGESGNVKEMFFNGRHEKILLTGESITSNSAHLANVVIPVPHPNIRIQESCHSAICHAIVEALLSE